MFKKTIRLRINSINLNKINFSLSPSIPLLKKDDLCLILNNAPFENFVLSLKVKVEEPDIALFHTSLSNTQILFIFR